MYRDRVQVFIFYRIGVQTLQMLAFRIQQIRKPSIHQPLVIQPLRHRFHCCEVNLLEMHRTNSM